MAKSMDDEVDKWYYDLKAMGDTIDANSRRHARANRRTIVLTVFVLFAFFLLAWRSEVNADRIERNAEKIGQAQKNSCLGGRQIIINFNAAQDRFIQLDRENPVPGAELLQQKRIELLKLNRIPVPECPR